MIIPDPGVLLTTLRAIAGTAKAAGSIELTSQVIDLQQQVLALIGSQSELTVQNHELKRRVAELEVAIAQREQFVFRHNAFWTGPDDREEYGPYCPTCLGAQGKAVRASHRGRTIYVCGACNNTVDLDPEASAALQRRRNVVHPGY